MFLLSHHQDSKAANAFDRMPPVLTESDVSHPHFDAYLPQQKKLKTSLLQHHSCFCFVFWWGGCQIGGVCKVFTGTLGWAVVLAVSGRPTD